MMTGPALSPLPAVSPTPVAATDGHEAAAARLGRLFVHRAAPGARKAARAREGGGITRTPLAHAEGCGYDRPDAWRRWVRA